MICSVTTNAVPELSDRIYSASQTRLDGTSSARVVQCITGSRGSLAAAYCSFARELQSRSFSGQLLLFSVSLKSVLIMVTYTTEQRVFLVETYLLKKKSYDRCLRKFRKRFPDSPRPSRQYIVDLFKKWRETGSVLNKKRNYKKRALTEVALQDIRARIELSPRKSSRRLAQECGISQSSVIRGLKTLNFYPYRISGAHKLHDTDPAVPMTIR